MKVRMLLKELKHMDPEAEVKLHGYYGDRLLFVLRHPSNDGVVWLETDADCDFKEQLSAHINTYLDYGRGIFSLFADLYDRGITKEEVKSCSDIVVADMYDVFLELANQDKEFLSSERRKSMKIVGFDEFCRMPAGTIFAPYEPIVLKEELAIKVDPGEEMPKDYPYYRHCFNGVMPLSPWLDSYTAPWGIGDQTDASFEIYDGDNNDYRDYEMFLILEEKDVDRMIEVLKWAKGGCVGDNPGEDR